MTGLDIFGVVIAMIFVYLLLSLLATTLNEWVMMLLNARGSTLRVAITTMLRDDKEKNEVLKNLFFRHPLYKKLSIGGNLSRYPSYLSNEMFTQIIIDLLTDGANYRKSIEDITLKIEELFPDSNSETRRLLLSLVTSSGSNIDLFKEEIEKWYSAVMDRASGWYQRRIKYILIVIGLVISVTFNADTFRISGALAKDKIMTEAILEQAIAFANNPTVKVKDRLTADNIPKEDSLYKKELVQINEDMSLIVKDLDSFVGMGWRKDTLKEITSSPEQIAKTLLGWFITAIAISFGAPFWFDLLKKVVSVRSSVPAKK